MTVSAETGLFIIAMAAALLPGISRRIGLPSSVGEILFGVVIGRSFLGLEMEGDWLPFLAHLGFLVLMFQAGMEIDFKLLKGQGRKAMGFHGMLFGLTIIIAWLCAVFLSQSVFIALVLSTTSLGLVMPILKESGIQSSDFGQRVLIAATIADFITLLGITFYVLWMQKGVGIDLLIPLPLFVAFAVLLWSARLWAWWNPEKAEKLLLTETLQEQGVRVSLALLFLFICLSEIVHLEPVLGAFMGGCILSFVLRKKENLESKISVIGFGFLIPMFFINVGMGFEIQNILTPERIFFTMQLFAASLLVKFVPCLIFPLWGMKLSEGLRAGALLSSRLSLIIAAAAVGLQEGYINIQTKDSIILLALVTCITGPVLFNKFSKLSRRSV
ncbi:cation:proton antiporter [Maridesulfovibrio bastinii]|uniref:cation:proton antiporter n=1 Tax=Maridesulfovibrio bastinii TaxID=47157 RepID=UPI0003FDAA8A|nr:cation:proton antiporter [Maridesulfovibrio bastinii]